MATHIPPAEITSHVNYYIRQLMSAVGWKQADVARIIGRDTSQTSRRMKGSVEWTLAELASICEALDAPVTVLFDSEAFAAFIANQRPPAPTAVMDRRRRRDQRNPPSWWNADSADVLNFPGDLPKKSVLRAAA